MNRWEKALFALAHHLHKGVWEIEANMTLKEFIGWLQYFAEINSSAKERPVDATELTPQRLKEMFP